MSNVRLTVECIFKDVSCKWSTVDYKREMRISQSPKGAFYIATMLLINMRKFFYPNTISQYFGLPPPSLEDYLLHENYLNIILAPQAPLLAPLYSLFE